MRNKADVFLPLQIYVGMMSGECRARTNVQMFCPSRQSAAIGMLIAAPIKSIFAAVSST